MRFVDLFVGLGGFRVALERLGLECVFACDVDPQLRELYVSNFPDGPEIYGDIRESKQHVPLTMCFVPGFHASPSLSRGPRLA